MFTINIYLKFALIAVFVIGGIILAILFGFWYSFPLLLIGVLLIVSYILLGTVQSASEIMQKMDLEKAERRLGLTLSPKLLYSANRAYYYMLKGTIALNQKRTDEGEMWLKKAQSIKIPTENEGAMIELQLANINAMRNKWKQAQIHYRNAKQMKITDNNVKEQMKQFEKALSNRGQMKAASRMGKGGMMQQGGKRRRPKMR